MTTSLPATRPPGAVSTEVCRLTIAGPAGRADLAVPVTTRISALMPVLMGHLPADPDRPVGAWVLQRLGEQPLDPDATPQSAALRHGEVLYLRPADDPLPELEFDDVAEGVARAVDSQLNRWRPELTRRLFLSLACLVLAALAAAVPWAGHGPVVPVLYGVTTIGMAAGCVLDRRPDERATVLITGIGACVFAALTGLSAVHGGAGLLSPGHTDILIGAAATLVMSAALLPVPGLALAASGTMLLTAGLAVFTGCLAAVFGWDADRSTTTTAVLFFLFGHLAPRASLRLARIRVPQLPRNADELQQDIEPQPELAVTRRAATADAVLTASSISTGLLCSSAFVLLAGGHGWIGWLFPLVFSGTLLLRSNSLKATWQRIPMVFSGALGLLTVVLSWSTSTTSSAVRCALLLGLLLVAAALLVGARWLPTNRLLPVWGHTADILEMLSALALLPLLVQLLHGYAYFRAQAS